MLYPALLQIFTLRRNGSLSSSLEAFAAGVARSQTIHLIEAGVAPKEALHSLSELVMNATHASTGSHEEHDQVASKIYQSVQPLVDEMYAMNSAKAHAIIDAAFRQYAVEDVCIYLLRGALYRIGTLWEEKQLSVAVEHFATNIIRTRLAYLFESTPNKQQGAIIFIACAPREPHEIGALMLALFWRRIGLNIVYLGQMVEIKSLLQEIRQRRPWIVCISAMTRPRVKDVAHVAREIAKLDAPRPIFCFGGGAFSRNKRLIESVKGIYLGTNADEATKRVQELERMHTTFTLTELGAMIP